MDIERIALIMMAVIMFSGMGAMWHSDRLWIYSPGVSRILNGNGAEIFKRLKLYKNVSYFFFGLAILFFSLIFIEPNKINSDYVVAATMTILAAVVVSIIIKSLPERRNRKNRYK